MSDREKGPEQWRDSSAPVNGCDPLCWFAVCTRSRQEKSAAALLQALGVICYLPLRTHVRQWTDRKMRVSVPLFSGYVFVRVSLSGSDKLRVLKTPGIAGFVGNSKGPLAIPDHQLEAVRSVTARTMDCSVHSLLEEGDAVRVVRGPLTGLQGHLVRKNSSSWLVISVTLIQRSIAVTIACEDVERIDQKAA